MTNPQKKPIFLTPTQVWKWMEEHPELGICIERGTDRLKVVKKEWYQ